MHKNNMDIIIEEDEDFIEWSLSSPNDETILDFGLETKVYQSEIDKIIKDVYI